jgi:tetratricopeptide (TPR) repeat protein
MSALGKRLRQLRVERGLTQTEVTGGEYSKEYVSQVELGKTEPSRRALKLFAKHLDIDESYFETGIDPGGRERFESLLTAGDVLTARGEVTEALAVFDRARVMALRTENPAYVWRVEVGRAWSLHRLGRHDQALDLLGGARAYFTTTASPARERAEVLFRMGSVREAVGDLQLALELFAETLTLLDTGAQPADSLRLRALSHIAGIHTRRHDLVAAAEAAQAALDVAAGAEDRRAVADAYWQAARVEERRGDYARSNEYALRARDLLVELGERSDAARVLRDLGVVKTHLGAFDDAQACFERGLDLLRAADDPTTRVELLNGAAAAKLAGGDCRGAFETAGESLDVLAREGSVEGAVRGRARLARCAALLGMAEVGRARMEWQAAADAFGAEADGATRGLLLVAEGDVLLAEGRVAEAAGAFRRATIVVQGMGI